MDNERNNKLLFWACFIALIATAFGFVIRTQLIGVWAEKFELDAVQKGQIFGVGIWPFAISIVLFSLIIDKIGYGWAMLFAFVCHVTSALLTIFATSYEMLWIGTFVVAIANGTVEAVVNPVVATLFPKEKTKWLNILHAGWPGGLVLGGLLGIGMDTYAASVEQPVGDFWQLKVGLILIPTLLYGLLMLGKRFPVNERVAAQVSYKEMLKEPGIIGALIAITLIVLAVGDAFELTMVPMLAMIAVLTIAYGLYVQSLGRPMFIFLLLIMIPLATTELGTDSWITDLMTPVMTTNHLNAGWVLVYTSLIMMVLRFFAGPIVHKISPLGLLCASSLIAALGLVALSQANEAMFILLAATLYGFGKTFFWPTTLGVVAEQFPKGGALTLNAIAGVGMLGVGVLGAPYFGYIQQTRIEAQITEEKPAVFAAIEKPSEPWALSLVLPETKSIDDAKVKELPVEDQTYITSVVDAVKKGTLATVAILPGIMLVCYLGLIVYFRAKGGYHAEVLTGHEAKDEDFTGGVPGPVE